MSDCIICGEPPSICRCSLEDRVAKRAATRVKFYKPYQTKDKISPLDMPDAALAMRTLERLWRSGYADLRWLHDFTSHFKDQTCST